MDKKKITLELELDKILRLSKEDLYNEIISQLVPRILDEIMLAERSSYLSNNPDDSANGFYSRTMFLKNLPLKLSIPRTRSSNFFPSSIPKYKRFLPDEYENLVESLILSSRSIESLKGTIKEMNMPISEER